MEKKKIIVLLAGPTASGKSKLAIKLAHYLNGEIINADSMQVYKEISILTSKPNLLQIKNIKHHLYGFNSVKKKFSTGAWLGLALEKIEEIWNSGKTPIIVGGTGLYFKALTDGLVKIPNIPNSIRLKIRRLHKKLGQKIFFNELIKLDPLSKKFIVPTDAHRSMRAYEVKEFTKKSLYEFTKQTKSNFNTNVFKRIFINTPKDVLHNKISQRVEKMFKEGAIKEVEEFFKLKVYRELSSNKIIGIKEIKSYLQGKVKLIEAKELIAQKTRQYAKRQFTWYRGHMKSWEMIYSSNINELFKKAINKIS
jgi:tRNA dimethylallyltransferase